jgi:hypothetical protein
MAVSPFGHPGALTCLALNIGAAMEVHRPHSCLLQRCVAETLGSAHALNIPFLFLAFRYTVSLREPNHS